MLSFNSVNDHHHLPSSPVLSLSSRCTTPRSAPFRHQDLDLHMEPSTGCGFQSTSFQRKPLQNSAPEENTLQESTTISLPATSKLNKLIQQLKSLLGSDGLTSEDIDISKVKALMESYELDELEWAHLALHDPLRNYSRNGIININNNANLLILVWSPGKSSAIHDHANAHCCMKVLKGQLVESLYDIPEAGGRMVLKSHSTLESGQVGYISDDIGLHKISNPMAECSVSLHLYTPPYAMLYGCSMYESGTGAKHHVDMSKYYSWQGQLTNE